MTPDCSVCGPATVDLRAPSADLPSLQNVDTGNWISLKRCRACNSLWVSAPYEPHASYIYLVRWRHNENDWRRIHDLDAGETLRKWHIASIRELWLTLDPAQKQAVEWHRERSFGRNPIDNLYDGPKPDLESLLNA